MLSLLAECAHSYVNLGNDAVTVLTPLQGGELLEEFASAREVVAQLSEEYKAAESKDFVSSSHGGHEHALAMSISRQWTHPHVCV